MTRSFTRPTFTIASLLVTLLAACQREAATPATECLAYPPDLTQTFATGLLRQDFRLANAWAVKSDKPITGDNNVTTPAYFVSADIIAPNGEAVVGTWLTDDITKEGHIYSVSPQAIKYSKYGGVGDRSTTGTTMDTGGAKQSIDCVLTHRAKPGQAAGTP
jgi:hypothetical protein